MVPQRCSADAQVAGVPGTPTEMPLTEAQVERKVSALAKYASQQHRRYSDPEYIRNVARTHGINVNREYAEVFQVYRVVA